MITEPLVLVKSVRCTVDAALETVVRAFENHGFAIVSKLDIYPKSHRLVGIPSGPRSFGRVSRRPGAPAIF